MTEAARRRVTGRAILAGGLVALAILVPAAWLVGQATAPQQVTGVVLDVRTRPPLAVDSFDLLAQDGRRLTFQVGPLDLDGGFDAGHLVTHKVTLAPVIVTYRQDGDRLVAVRLADAPVAAVPVGSAAASGSAAGSPSAAGSATP